MENIHITVKPNTAAAFIRESLEYAGFHVSGESCNPDENIMEICGHIRMDCPSLTPAGQAAREKGITSTAQCVVDAT